VAGSVAAIRPRTAPCAPGRAASGNRHPAELCPADARAAARLRPPAPSARMPF